MRRGKDYSKNRFRTCEQPEKSVRENVLCKWNSIRQDLSTGCPGSTQ